MQHSPQVQPENLAPFCVTSEDRKDDGPRRNTENGGVLGARGRRYGRADEPAGSGWLYLHYDLHLSDMSRSVIGEVQEEYGCGGETNVRIMYVSFRDYPYFRRH